MKKQELIDELNKIDGNPDIVFRVDEDVCCSDEYSKFFAYSAGPVRKTKIIEHHECLYLEDDGLDSITDHIYCELEENEEFFKNLPEYKKDELVELKISKLDQTEAIVIDIDV